MRAIYYFNLALYTPSQYSMRQENHLPAVMLIGLAMFTMPACSSRNDNSHTTATTVVAPPPRQVLTVVRKSVVQVPAPPATLDTSVDPRKPLLQLYLDDHKTLKVGEELLVVFGVFNARVRSEGGEYRVRYIIDDDDMQWIDSTEPFAISGWVPGIHTFRMELVGPDGWPYRNGSANVVTRELKVIN